VLTKSLFRHSRPEVRGRLWRESSASSSLCCRLSSQADPIAKRHRITLTDDERRHLKNLVARRSGHAEPVKRAVILLASDEADGAPALTDAEIAERG